MSNKQFFIGEKEFRIWLPDIDFVEKADDDYNSRQIHGIMSTDRRDRQGETVVAKGLDFDDFLKSGHFNDNHSQETSAIVGYPESAHYHTDLAKFDSKLKGVEGWTCKGYVLKGTKRADAIWELAKALASVPGKRLGFSIEGRVTRRNDKTIEKARIRNVAITNCPVNTDATWEALMKSMESSDDAMKAMTAGFAVSPATQSGGGALRSEDLDSKAKDVMERKKKAEESLKRALHFDDMLKSMEVVLEHRPDFDPEAAAVFINHLFQREKRP